MLLRITEQAAEQIKISIDSLDAQVTTALRIAAKRGPDGSIEYAMGFDDAGDNDTVSNQHGIQVAIAPTSLDLLNGAILDFDTPEGEQASQFIFLNPNDPHFSPPETAES